MRQNIPSIEIKHTIYRDETYHLLRQNTLSIETKSTGNSLIPVILLIFRNSTLDKNNFINFVP